MSKIFFITKSRWTEKCCCGTERQMEQKEEEKKNEEKRAWHFALGFLFGFISCCCRSSYFPSYVFVYLIFFLFLSVDIVIPLSSSCIWVDKVAVYGKSKGNTKNAPGCRKFVKTTGKIHTRTHKHGICGISPRRKLIFKIMKWRYDAMRLRCEQPMARRM